MIAALRLIHRPLVSLLSLVALAGGPGFSAVEAYEHTHRSSPGHGHNDHYEGRGGQDHDDVCRIWRTSAPVRAPDLPATTVRLPDPVPGVSCGALPSLATASSHRLPHSRAPPLPTR